MSHKRPRPSPSADGVCSSTPPARARRVQKTPGAGPPPVRSMAMTDAPTGLRAQRKEETRAAIRDAAFRLFAEQGFEATTVDDIARAADVSPRTFFRYFPTKDDVVFADHPERIERLRQALLDRPADEPVLASVREAILTLADDIDLHSDTARLQSKVSSASPTLASRSLELQNE